MGGCLLQGSPYLWESEKKELAERVLLGKEHFQLPIVYLTKKMGRLLPSECRAAFGAASGNGSCIERNDAGAWEASEKKCNGENPHHGAIGIYYPCVSAENKKIHFEPYTEEILLQKIVNMIYRYENQQTVR